MDITDPGHPANIARDARRQRWNEALATGDTALIEQTRDELLLDGARALMNDDPNYAAAGWTPGR